MNIQGRNQLWVGGEDTLQGGFFALLDCEVTWLLNHARSLQNNQVLENNKWGESDGINQLMVDIPENAMRYPTLF